MNQKQQRRFDAFLRSQEFLDSNAGIVGTLATSAGRKELDVAVTALAGHADVQGSANLRMAGQISNERALEAAIRNEHMKPIATFARARLRGAPDFATLTRRVETLHGPRLVRAAAAMATAAEPYVAAFPAGGLPPETLAQLGAAADALQEAITHRGSSRVRRVQATKAVEQQISIGRDATNVLHAIISKQFANDPTFLAGWNAARRVGAKKGPVRGSGAVIGSVTPVAPSPAAVVAA